MKLYRYMSLEEFVKMSMGKNMRMNYRQQFIRQKTNSKGFCFIGSTTIGKSTDDDKSTWEFSPEECFLFLEGVVSDEILVEFEGNNIPESLSGYGIYLNPYIAAEMQINEYSLLEYNTNILKPLRYLICPNPDNNIWEEFSEEKNYTMQDMIRLLIEHKDKRYYHLKNILKLLPTVPNYSNDNIWRILPNTEDGINSLVYGNPITGENIYELRFNYKTYDIDFGKNMPESWQTLKNLYNNTPNLLDDDMVFEIAILIATYPQILDIFNLIINEDRDICLKNNDIELRTLDLKFRLTENNTLMIGYDDEDYEFICLIESPLPYQNEHTSTEIGNYVSSINFSEFTQGLKIITAANIITLEDPNR